MTLVAPLLVQAPAITPSRYGLASVAERDSSTPDRWTGVGVEYLPNPAPHAKFGEINLCPDEPTDGPYDPIPTVGGWEDERVQGVPFRIWSAFTTKAPGMSRGEVRSRATTQLAAGEGAAVERVAWDQLDGAMATGAVDLGSAGLVAAVGELERWLGTSYAGVGSIHAPRQLGTSFGKHNLAKPQGSQMQTFLGTPVSFGNYPATGPGGTSAPAGHVWLLATGTVKLWQSDVQVHTDQNSAWFSATTNDATAIAERQHAVSWDGVAAAILVDLAGPDADTGGDGYPGDFNFPDSGNYPLEG